MINLVTQNLLTIKVFTVDLVDFHDDTDHRSRWLDTGDRPPALYFLKLQEGIKQPWNKFVRRNNYRNDIGTCHSRCYGVNDLLGKLEGMRNPVDFEGMTFERVDRHN